MKSLTELAALLVLSLCLATTPSGAAPAEPTAPGDAQSLPGIESPERVYAEVGAEPNAGQITQDVLIHRPLGFLQLAIGAVAFVPAWVLAYPFGGSDEVTRACITDPAQRTFHRPLGRL